MLFTMLTRVSAVLLKQDLSASTLLHPALACRATFSRAWRRCAIAAARRAKTYLPPCLRASVVAVFSQLSNSSHPNLALDRVNQLLRVPAYAVFKHQLHILN